MNTHAPATDDLRASIDARLAVRIAALDWPHLLAQLDGEGFALTGPILTPGECAALIALDADEARFRKRIVMERYRYGAGDYGYFSHPLPPLVGALREALYARLAPLANEWGARLASSRKPAAEYPAALPAFLKRCHAAGQQRPTPLLLHYETGGYNALHQDLYGAVAFPLQATCFLSARGVEGGMTNSEDTHYSGGEFLLVENRPRQQARGTALVPEQGALVLFPSAERPVAGKRGYLRARMRHGVSTVTRGRRYTLGIIFHDAE